MRAMKAWALMAPILALAACQTTGASKDDDLALRVAGMVQVIPLTLERCEAADPPNRAAYAAERERYEAENRWIADAAYKVIERRIDSTRDGLQGFVRGVADKRMADIFGKARQGEAEKGCLRILSQCRLREQHCRPLDQVRPDEVRALVAQATS